MPPTPPSSTSSNTGQSPTDGHFRVVRKRNRVPLSCGPCRHRKLKCNRSSPCDNCIKRGEVTSCSYATPNVRKKSSSSSGASGNPNEMQGRIDRLESLILSLMTNGGQAAGPTAATAAIAGAHSGSSISGSSPGFLLDSESVREELEEVDENEVDKMSKQMGVMKMDSGKTIFASDAHWYSILAEISEVKNHFAEHKKQYDEQFRNVRERAVQQNGSSTSFFPFVTEKRATHAEIFAAFPPKQTTDFLISRFFNNYNYDPSFHIIHGPTYQRQYDQHWVTPGETPLIWLAMTYAMMVVAGQSFSRAADEPPEYRALLPQMIADYRRLTVQCLTLVDITSPVAYMLETLLLCVIAELGRTRDAETNVLLGVSIIVRLAMRMGYHRDSRHFPELTPFQGEMRRRIWTVVRQSDLLFSMQAGLPPMIRPHDTNTEAPRNLYDDELSEDMKELPASRPMTENTPMTYVIYKSQLIKAYGEVAEAVSTLNCSTYETVMKLDHKLREIHANIPPIYRMRTMDEALRDPSALVMQRHILDLLFHKSQSVLHRKFMCPSREPTRYVYSRRTCIDNAMEMLRHHATLHNESRPGGRLSDVKWFISSLTTNDFLLAAMIVALDLYQTAEAERQGRRASNDTYDWWSHERRSEMLQALETSRSIWGTLQDQSLEALKAYGVLSAMLGKLQSHEAQLRQAVQNGSFTEGAGFSNPGAAREDVNVAPEHSAAMTLGMLSTGGMTPDSVNIFANFNGVGGQQGQNPTTASGAGIEPSFLGTAEGNTNGSVNTPSPFSNIFGPAGGLNMEMGGTNIDWDAWDSFLQNGAVNVDASAATNGVSNSLPTQNQAFNAGLGMWPGNMNMNMNVDMNGNHNMSDNNEVEGKATSPTQQPANGPGANGVGFQMAGNGFLAGVRGAF